MYKVHTTFHCAYCFRDFLCAKPQDPCLDAWFGACPECRPAVAESMARFGYAGRRLTVEEVRAWQERYA